MRLASAAERLSRGAAMSGRPRVVWHRGVRRTPSPRASRIVRDAVRRHVETLFGPARLLGASCAARGRPAVCVLEVEHPARSLVIVAWLDAGDLCVARYPRRPAPRR